MNAEQEEGAAREMNVERYDETARGINSLMYDYYAKAIMEKSGITQGVCLDAGSSGGYLGLALARITDLDFIFLDISPKGIEKAEANIVQDGLRQRARTLEADVHAIPLQDGSVDLAISRGSIPFWADPAAALKELFRVLAPGGNAYIITGRGSAEVRARIEAKRRELGLEDEWACHKERPGHWRKEMPRRNYEELLKDMGITNCSVAKGEDGNWIHLWKEPE